MQKKFELTKETKGCFGKTLFRVRAVVSFGSVVTGELGGFLEKEGNLSHDGDAWVSGDARVYGDAWVYGDARVSGNARVYGDAWVSVVLCSRFNFSSTAQIELWLKKEKEFEKEVKSL